MSDSADTANLPDRLAARKERLEDLSGRVRRLRLLVLVVAALEAGAVLALVLSTPLLA
ncbi:MAG: hypothetical protein OEM67_04165 [Thermoleophilia bacterium]|nr:hypothetical protein [Thermoleophilia bacterium]MDH3725194.1 hypothetical protein [Thermoleophilia bacterium]